MPDDFDEDSLARNMVDVHGPAAAIVARENASGAALAGQPAQAKSWIRVLGIIQRRQANSTALARLLPLIAAKSEKRTDTMYISFATSRAAGFKKWSDSHPLASNDDDYPAGATPVALAAPGADAAEAAEQPHLPWLVPGVGISL